MINNATHQTLEFSYWSMLDEMGELTKKPFCTHSNRKLVVKKLNG